MQVRLGQHGLSQAGVGIRTLGLPLGKLDFLEVAGLLLGQQRGMGVLPRIHFGHKEERNQLPSLSLECKRAADAAATFGFRWQQPAAETLHSQSRLFHQWLEYPRASM